MGTVRRLCSPRSWAAAVLALAGLGLAGCAPAGSGAPGSAEARVGEAAGPAGGSQVTIKNIGSDTLVNLALAWAEAYMAAHPEVHISVTGGGSGTGIAALINRTILLANASRAMSPEEIVSARAAGFEPVQHTVALDAIAVVVNRANPVDRLTLQQISDIYTGRIRRWSGVGGEDRPIVLLSRESNSGTYVYFIERVIRLGQKENKKLPSPETLLMPSSEGISNEVRQNPNAIGYDGLGYVTADQKVLAVAAEQGGPYVRPEAATVLDGSYPIARPLYMYTAGPPQGAVEDYLSWILGPGQGLIQGLGFVPLAEGKK